MKGNLHGFLLAALMIAIAVFGTAHHLATAGHAAADGPTARASLATGVGLLERGPEVPSAGVDAGPDPCEPAPGATQVGDTPACKGARAPAPADAPHPVTPAADSL